MFSLIKIIPIVLLLFGLSYGYHLKVTSDLEGEVNRLTDDNQTLKDNNSVLKTTSDKNASEARRFEQQSKDERLRINTLESKFRNIQSDNKLMMQIFKDHDLSNSARRKPDIIQKLANKATANVFRSIEDASKEIQELGDKE